MEIGTKINIIIIVILFLIISIVFGAFASILFHILKYISKKTGWKLNYFHNKNVLHYFLIFSTIFSLYTAYTAVYPTDSFYYDEFEYVTNRKIPKSAKIRFKDSSYPDIHGDYFSKSIFELSPQDYNKLLLELKSDRNLSETNDVSHEQDCKIFERKIPGKTDQFLFIKFLNDKKTIIVDVAFN